MVPFVHDLARKKTRRELGKKAERERKRKREREKESESEGRKKKRKRVFHFTTPLAAGQITIQQHF